MITRGGAKRNVKSRRPYIFVQSVTKNEINIDTFFGKVMKVQASLSTDERPGLQANNTGTHKFLIIKEKMYISKSATLLKLLILSMFSCGAVEQRARDTTNSSVVTFFSNSSA